MSIQIIFLASLMATTTASIEQDWENFKTTFGKTYGNSKEEMKRMQIFISQVEYINQHNLLYEQGHSTFTVGINNFSDLTMDEFHSFLSRSSPSPLYHLAEAEMADGRLKSAPDFFDWRDHGIVTSVKGQGHCGSAMIFAEIAAVESVWAKNTGDLYDLSTQQVIDCGSGDPCNGGFLNDGYKTIIEMGGIMSAADYPQSKDSCRYDEDLAVAHISSVGQVPALDEHEMAESLYLQGPLTFALDASCRSFQHYHSGVYYDPSCGDQGTVNHIMLLVGYDKSGPLENNYWMARNSWGASWGDYGYINMRMWKNTANMARYVSYPIV